MTKTVHSIKLIPYNAVSLDRLAYDKGDVVYDVTSGTLRLMDGSTLGGTKISTQAYVDSKIATEVTGRNSAIAGAISTEVTNRNSAISTALSTYVTSSGLTSTLASYATTASLSSYATTASLSSYATTASLSSYATTASLSSYATTASLSSYPTNSVLTTSVGTVVDVNSMSTYVLLAAANSNTYNDVTLLTESFSGRKLADINNDGSVTSADALSILKYSQSALDPVTDASAISYIETVFIPKLLSDTVKYSRYLIVKSNLTSTLARYATNANLALKAPTASPTFTGTVTAPKAIIGGVNIKPFSIAMSIAFGG
jgi:hypothetical protein